MFALCVRRPSVNVINREHREPTAESRPMNVSSVENTLLLLFPLDNTREPAQERKAEGHSIDVLT